MTDRIRLLMEYKELTSTQFADTIDVPRAVISHIIGGRNKPSLDVVIKIASAFPEISKEWLLSGVGEMLISLAPHNQHKVTNSGSYTSAINNGDVFKSAEKVQDDFTEKVSVPLPHEAGKSIEQIVIFYSDKSFVVYKP
jgi:DNA-binding XRE family transcriptional regulator